MSSCLTAFHSTVRGGLSPFLQTTHMINGPLLPFYICPRRLFRECALILGILALSLRALARLGCAAPETDDGMRKCAKRIFAYHHPRRSFRARDSARQSTQHPHFCHHPRRSLRKGLAPSPHKGVLWSRRMRLAHSPGPQDWIRRAPQARASTGVSHQIHFRSMFIYTHYSL